MSSTGGPRISWFHNSWSSRFRDLLSDTNFVNSSQFRDFEAKRKKKSEKFSEFFSEFFFQIYTLIFCSILFFFIQKYLIVLLHESNEFTLYQRNVSMLVRLWYFERAKLLFSVQHRIQNCLLNLKELNEIIRVKFNFIWTCWS